MALIKEIRSANDFIDTVYVIIALSGLYFFNRIKNGKGGFLYISEKRHKNLIPLIYLCQMMVGLAMQYFFVPEMAHHSSYEIAMYEMLHVHLCCSTFYTMLMLYKKSEKFIQTFKMLDNIDRILKRRNLDTSYVLAQKFAYLPFIAPLTFVIFAYQMTRNDGILSNFLIFNVSEHNCFVVPLAVHGYSVYYLAVFGLIVHRRLKTLNTELRRLKNEPNLRIIEQELVIFAAIHSDLCKIWDNIRAVFGWPVVSLHFLTYILLTCFALSRLHIAFQTLGFEMLTYPIMMMAIISLSIIVGELIKTEAPETGNVLSEFVTTEHLLKSNVIIVVKTFHLQLLHRNFDIILCGCFDLSLHHFGTALKSITNLIMFMIQLKG